MSDQAKIVFDEELVQHYARVKNMPIDEARRKACLFINVL